MSLNLILEEIEILQSIFCQDGEFTLHSNIDSIENPGNFSISYSIEIKVESEHESNLAERSSRAVENPRDEVVIVLTVNVNEKYPNELEGLSLKSAALIKRNINEIKAELDMHIAGNLLNSSGDPFVMEVVEWIKNTVQEKISAWISATQDCDEKGHKIYKCVVLSLDHMRSKQKYTRLITRWMSELRLVGRVILFKKNIWVVIQGGNDDVRVYLKRHKTCNVDVDSNGRPCKERMMNIVVDMDAAVDSDILSGVKVIECKTWDEVSAEFVTFGVDPEEMRK